MKKADGPSGMPLAAESECGVSCLDFRQLRVHGSSKRTDKEFATCRLTPLMFFIRVHCGIVPFQAGAINS
jgi:hypothetical protein